MSAQLHHELCMKSHNEVLKCNKVTVQPYDVSVVNESLPDPQLLTENKIE